MNKSESLKNIAKALVTFHLKVGKIGKDASNPFFKSKYASLSNILEQINTPLIEAGLTFTQFPTDENGLTTILMHSESGEFIESCYFMRPVKDDPQGRGSAITYQRRYALASVLGLNVAEDDDANEASGLNWKEPADNKPWLNKGSKEFLGAIKKLEEGTTTISKIEAAFKLSKEIKTELQNHIKAA
jgi:hypothetical protein